MSGTTRPRKNEDPTSDDEGANDFIDDRILNADKPWIPCPWYALRQVSTQQQVCDLACKILFLMQDMALSNYGGKFPFFFNDQGNPKMGWEIRVNYPELNTLQKIVSKTAKICFRFIRMFNLLRLRYTRSVAVNLFDGQVTEREGICDLVHDFINFMLGNRDTKTSLTHCIEHCSMLLACEDQFAIGEVKLYGFDEADMATLEIDDLSVERPGGALVMDRDPLVMLKLATKGFIWNTDKETTSLLTAVAPLDSICSTIGVWRPLCRDERNSLTDAVDVNGNFRVTGTSQWVVRTWDRHSFMQMQALFHRHRNRPGGMKVRYVPMPSCELKEIRQEFVTAYSWHANNPEQWAPQLHGSLFRLKSQGFNPKHEEVGRAILQARIAAEKKFGWCDGYFEMLFGPINTTFSYACESTSSKEFAKLHLMRCMRVIGVTTKVEGTPLYKWQPPEGDESPVAKLAEQAWRLKPILATHQGKLFPSLK